MYKVFLVLGLLSGCGHLPGDEAPVISMAWFDILGMRSYAPPATTWYAPHDRGCGTALEGAAFADGACLGDQLSLDPRRQTSAINAAWPGSFAASNWCAGAIGIADTLVGGVPLQWPPAADPFVVDCQVRLAAAGY